MLVSVVMHVWNGADYLREALESVAAQTYSEIEIIVVDDGSTDDTAAICQAFGSRLRYFYQEKDGTKGATAQGRAFREASGDYIAGLDQDDRWLPTKIAKQVAALDDNPIVGVVFTGVRLIDRDGNAVGPWQPVMPAGDVFHVLLSGNRYCYSSALMRSSALSVSGPPDLDTGMGDWDRWLRMARHFPFMVIDECLTEYRVHSNSSSADQVRVAQATQRVLERHQSCLHPGCKECKRNLLKGWELVSRAYLGNFRVNAAAARFSASFPYLWAAINFDPRYALRPRELYLNLLHCGAGVKRMIRKKS